MEHVFQRKIYQQILQWKQENDGRSALLVEGACLTLTSAIT